MEMEGRTLLLPTPTHRAGSNAHMDRDPSPAPSRADLDLLLAHAGWMRALAYNLLGDRSAADDVVQDATIALLIRPPDQPVVLEAGRLQPLALQGLDGVAPQPQDFHDPPLRPSRASTLQERHPKHAHADDHA